MCEKCEGKLWYVVPNHQHDILERIECLDCISVLQYNDDVKERITKIIVNASPQKLAQIVSEGVVNGVAKNDKESVEERFEQLIATKDINTILALATTYAGV